MNSRQSSDIIPWLWCVLVFLFFHTILFDGVKSAYRNVFASTDARSSPSPRFKEHRPSCACPAISCCDGNYRSYYRMPTSLVVYWSESLTTNHEVPGSIPGSTVGIFLEGEYSRGDHGLGRLVEFRFKAPPGTTSSSITTHTPSEQRNCASWASQP